MIKHIRYNNPKSTLFSEQFVKVNFNLAEGNPVFTVYHSYKIKTAKQIKNALLAIHKDILYKELVSLYGYSRSIKSEIREWKAHNILYKLKIRVSQTKDTDFSSKESRLRRIGYFLLSSLYWIVR